jgi:uncharacterized small protein (DUF1192 family)
MSDDLIAKLAKYAPVSNDPHLREAALVAIARLSALNTEVERLREAERAAWIAGRDAAADEAQMQAKLREGQQDRALMEGHRDRASDLRERFFEALMIRDRINALKPEAKP